MIEFFGRTLCSICALILLSAPMNAEPLSSKPLQSQFTFKTVTPPAVGTKRRLTIQIAPKNNDGISVPRDLTVAVPSRKKAARSQADWFWDRVNPALEPPENGRWTQAVAAAKLGDAHGLTAPSVQNMTETIDAYGREILLQAGQSGLSPAFILAVITVESAGKPRAVSGAGAQGLMQLIPATASRFSVEDVNDPNDNIRAGATYLKWLKQEFYGDPLLALAGYNAGENAVKAHGGVPPFSETRNYIPKVLRAWTIARSMCRTPPVLHTDGCVFSVPTRPMARPGPLAE